MSVLRDPEHLSPDERRRELVAILAAGVVRIRRLRAACGNSSESTAARLDVPRKTVLIGRIGLTAREAK